MKIHELVNNQEFEFNPHFRIYRYIPTVSYEEGEAVLEYDSYSDKDIPLNLLNEDITAINQAINGCVEIEHL